MAGVRQECRGGQSPRQVTVAQNLDGQSAGKGPEQEGPNTQGHGDQSLAPQLHGPEHHQAHLKGNRKGFNRREVGPTFEIEKRGQWYRERTRGHGPWRASPAVLLCVWPTGLH